MAEGPTPISSSERSRRLAERFGMTREDVDRLLSTTHEEYAAATVPTSALPPVEDKPEPAIERAAETIPARPIATAMPTMPTTRPLGGGTIAIIFALLLIGLGIALSFRDGWFKQRHEPQAATPVDTMQNLLDSAARHASEPRPVTNTPPGVVPPEALVVPREEPPGTSGPTSNSGATTESEAQQASHIAPRPLLTTTSEYEAQEKLAELRADGNTRAHIRASRTAHGVTYRVLGR